MGLPIFAWFVTYSWINPDRGEHWQRSSRKCLASCYCPLSTVAENVAAPETPAAIRRELIYDAMDSRHKRVMEKLDELLNPHEKGHPITYDLSYVETSRNLVKADVKARLENYQRQNIQIVNSGTNNVAFQAPESLQIYQVISALKLGTEDIEEFDSTDILTSTQAYYGVRFPAMMGLRHH